MPVMVVSRPGRSRYAAVLFNGYYQVGETSNILNVGYLISGGYKGADGTASQYTVLPPIVVTTSETNGNTNLSSTPQVANDPINFYSGGFLYDHDDIGVGSAKYPFGLTLTRSYDTVNRASQTALGWGWRHNFMISAVPDSDSYGAFGDYNPLAAVATAVNAYVATDLLSSSTASPAIGNMISASESANWLMDQLVNNAAKVTLPHSVKKFTKVPSTSGTATFVPPPGDASTLTVNSNGTFTITDKTQTVMNFDAAGNISTWVDSNGNTVTFTYTGSGASELLSTVSNGMGRTLTLSYNGSNQLTGVSDGTRSVAYTYDGSGNFSTYTDTTSQQTTFSYQSGAPGFLTKIFYPT